jgi:hypothetical protein
MLPQKIRLAGSDPDPYPILDSCGNCKILQRNEVAMICRQKLDTMSILCAWTLAAACTGCHREPPSQVEAAIPRQTPEQSFQEIVRIVKDGIEMRGGGSVSGFVSQGTGASSRFQVNNTVTSEVIPPANSDDVYRGKITITSSSVYSLRRTGEESDDTRDEEKKVQDKSFSLLDDSEEESSGFDVMDDELVSASPNGEKLDKGPIESIQRRADEEVRSYDFAYENGRWVLKTKLDPKTEASIENAFNRALSLQP